VVNSFWATLEASPLKETIPSLTFTSVLVAMPFRNS
jgi:hypothetical protein